MVTVINFSHPMSQDALDALSEVVGTDDVTVYHIPVHINDMENVRNEVRSLLEQAVDAAGGNPLNVDCMVPPGHGLGAAVMVAEMTKLWGYLPHFIVVGRVPDTVPPRWKPSKLIRNSN